MHAYFWHSVRSSKSALIYIMITVDLVIFGCLISHEIFIWGLFTKFKIRECSCLSSSAIIIIIFARFFNSRIRSPREIREN